MFATLPTNSEGFAAWSWAEITPFYAELAKRPLTEGTVHQWLVDWSQLTKHIFERFSRLSVAKTIDTTDDQAEADFNDYMESIYMPSQKMEQTLRLRLLESELEPAGMAEPLRKLRAEVALFREENLPLQTAERKLSSEYDKITGTQTVEWQGEERTLTQLQPFFNTPDRSQREQIWRLKAARQLDDRSAINDLWEQLLANRQAQAANAGFASYRDYRWQLLKRFAYSPADSQVFREAIATVVVPAANRIYAQKRAELEVESLRPWDINLDFQVMSFPPLQPFADAGELADRAASMFHRVDPQLGAYFDIMREEALLDLPNRKGKRPGGYCTRFPVAKRPFIFMNAVGAARDVTTMLHEAGHAFHVFSASNLPYVQQVRANMEFNEVASMAMELLAAPYLAAHDGGFYSEVEAAHHRREHLQKIILFWPYMAVVDAFQHWVYENPTAAADPAQCDAQWGVLWGQFLPGLDWNGFEDAMVTGWQRKQHIHRAPFYYIEYGMAQVGAIQVWRNALQDQSGAVASYRKALSLGGTVTLPALYHAAGARFAFDEPMLQTVVDLIEKTITELESLTV